MRDDIHEDVCRTASIAELGSFVQAYGSKSLDASLLLLPLVGFLPPTDPRIIGTVKAIERRSSSTGSSCATIPARCSTGCRPAKGRFSPAASGSPTITSCRAASTRRAHCSSGCLSLRNDVGLLAEEYDPRIGRQVGNFPQAFSHVALVNTAFNLTRAQGPAEQRAEKRAPASRRPRYPGNRRDLSLASDRAASALRKAAAQSPTARRAPAISRP